VLDNLTCALVPVKEVRVFPIMMTQSRAYRLVHKLIEERIKCMFCCQEFLKRHCRRVHSFSWYKFYVMEFEFK
jgi:hypothetical protein